MIAAIAPPGERTLRGRPVQYGNREQPAFHSVRGNYFLSMPGSGAGPRAARGPAPLLILLHFLVRDQRGNGQSTASSALGDGATVVWPLLNRRPGRLSMSTRPWSSAPARAAIRRRP